MDTKTFLAAGIAVALLIGVAAVFLASGDPDGLESTALVVQGDKPLTGDAPPGAEVSEDPGSAFVYRAPFPDYSIGDSPGRRGSIIAIVGGTILAFAGVWGMSRIVARRRTNNQ